MISQVLAMDLQTSGTGSSGGAMALSIILLIAILFFLVWWSLKKYFIDKKDSMLPVINHTKTVIKIVFINIFLLLAINSQVAAEINFKPLFENSERDLSLRLLDVMPELNTLSVGNDDASNIIIEFLDYNCGFCKRIHPELMELAEEEDVKLYFFHFPILSDTSRFYAQTVLAVALQDINRALDVHHAMMSVSGSLTKKKVESILKRADVNLNQFASDMQGVELVEMLEVSYFLAKKIGAKGTPTLVINNQVIPGYIPKNSILGMLK